MTGMNIDEITTMLPHSYPFLLLDRVTEYEKDQYIGGYKNVTCNEPFFLGHFPKRAIMPGVMIIESLAQLSGVLAIKSIVGSEKNIFFLASIDNVKFKKIVIPGDKLILKSTVTKQKSKIWKFNCTAYVDDVIACSANLMIAKE